jgi:hypothetical protein
VRVRVRESERERDREGVVVRAVNEPSEPSFGELDSAHLREFV